MKKRSSKILSSLLAIAMVMANVGGLSVTASATATDASNWADYVPTGEMPTNIFMTDQGTNTSASRNFRAAGERNPSSCITFVNGGDWVAAAKNYAYQTSTATTAIARDENFGYQGVIFKTTNSFLTSMERFDPNKSYVISFDAKNSGSTDVNLGVAISNGTSNTLTYTKEYGYEGMTLSGEYQTFNATFKPSANFSSSETNIIAIGFPEGTEAGSTVTFDTSDINALYIGEEKAYDITNVPVSGSGFVMAGREISYVAEVVNQLGLGGYLTQEFDWYVLNEAKTEILDDFTITADGAVATIAVPITAKNGNYTVAAVSEEYGMVKTAKLEVAGFENFVDHVPGQKPQNLIGNSANNASRVIYANSARNSTYLVVDNDQTSAWINKNDGNARYATKMITYTPKADSGLSAMDLPTPDGSLFGGMWIRTANNPQQLKVSNFDPDKSYVFSMMVKNAGSTENVRVGLSMSNYGTASESYSKEYGTEGMLLTSEYQEFKATIKPGAGYNPAAADHNLMVGAPIGTKANSVIHIDMTDDEAIYFAEETAYDIEITAESDTYIVNKNTIDLSAKVYNQLGLEGYLSQEFEWFALNTERTAYIDEIQFTADETGRKATASWGNNLPNGKYLIVARSKEYGLIRTLTIVVADEYLKDKAETQMPENILSIVSTNNPNGYAARAFYQGARRYGNTAYGNVSTANEDWIASAGTYREKFLRADANIVSDNLYGFEGLFLSTQNEFLSGMARLEPNKSYVFSAKVKNAGETDAKLGLAISNGTANTLAYSKEYGQNGVTIGKEYETFAATVKVSPNFNSNADNIITIGFPAGVKSGTKVNFSFEDGADSIYLAEEKPFKVELSCDKLTSLLPGSEIDIKAEVVNQVGRTGTLSQSVTWYCMNDEGTQTVPGVQIHPYAGGAKVVFGSIPAGTDSVRIYVASNDYDLVSGINPVALDVEAKQTIYVSPNGSDSADGAESRPLATLKGARDRIRALANEGLNAPVDVIFASGRYYFDNTVDFTALDSRTSSTKVTYKAADGAEVIFTGAVEIDMSDAKEITDDSILSRIKNDELKKQIVEIDLDGQLPYEWSSDAAIRATLNGICGGYEYPEIYLDGQEQTLAQWPNGDGEYSSFKYIDSDTIGYKETDPSRWSGAKDWWLGGFLSYDYLYMRICW